MRSLTTNPLLGADGHLPAASPAVDAETCSGAPTDDFDGDPRPRGLWCDVGADEAAFAGSYTLTIVKEGSGKGTVTSQPSGISCGSACLQLYPANTLVVLTASPDAGSRFAGWSGDADCSDGQVTMNGDKNCVATFELANFTLTVSRTGSGSGTVTSVPQGISCGTTCIAAFLFDTSVRLVATPDAGSSFAGWSGDCSGNSPSLLLLINRNLGCAARFEQQVVAEWWLPVVAKLAGVGGSYFYSDVVVLNVGDGVAEVGVTYYPAGGGVVEVEHFAEIGVGRQRLFEDIVGMLGKVGTKGVLRVRGTRPLLVFSRTYNKLAEGNALGLSAGTTFGQYVEAYRFAEA